MPRTRKDEAPIGISEPVIEGRYVELDDEVAAATGLSGRAAPDTPFAVEDLPNGCGQDEVPYRVWRGAQ